VTVQWLCRRVFEWFTPEESVELLHHSFPGLRVIRQSAETLPRILIYYRQNAEPAAIDQPITHKIHTPALVWPARTRQRNTQVGRQFGPFCGAHLQLFLPVQPVHPFRIYRPTLASQQHCQPSIAVANSAPGQFAQPHAQFVLRIAATPIPMGPARNQHQPAGTLLAHLVRLANTADQLATNCGLQTFFDRTSCKMCLSKLRSATSNLSFWFSSRN